MCRQPGLSKHDVITWLEWNNCRWHPPTEITKTPFWSFVFLSRITWRQTAASVTLIICSIKYVGTLGIDFSTHISDTKLWVAPELIRAFVSKPRATTFTISNELMNLLNDWALWLPQAPVLPGQLRVAVSRRRNRTVNRDMSWLTASETKPATEKIRTLRKGPLLRMGYPTRFWTAHCC